MCNRSSSCVGAGGRLSRRMTNTSHTNLLETTFGVNFNVTKLKAGIKRSVL